MDRADLKSLFFLSNMKYIHRLLDTRQSATYHAFIDDFLFKLNLSLILANVEYIVVEIITSSYLLSTFPIRKRLVKSPFFPISALSQHELHQKPQTHRPLPMRQNHICHNLRTPLLQRLLLPRMPAPIRIRIRSHPRHPLIRHAAPPILQTAPWLF